MCASGCETEWPINLNLVEDSVQSKSLVDYQFKSRRGISSMKILPGRHTHDMSHELVADTKCMLIVDSREPWKTGPYCSKKVNSVLRFLGCGLNDGTVAILKGGFLEPQGRRQHTFRCICPINLTGCCDVLLADELLHAAMQREVRLRTLKRSKPRIHAADEPGSSES